MFKAIAKLLGGLFGGKKGCCEPAPTPAQEKLKSVMEAPYKVEAPVVPAPAMTPAKKAPAKKPATKKAPAKKRAPKKQA